MEFRVTLLPVGTSVSGIKLTGDNRRNLVAGWCYGVDPLADLPADPFSFDQAYGLDLLTDLTDDDLPLATFGWSGQSVTDLDNWSARRRIIEPEPDSGGWAVLTAARRTADGRARFHQFQDQADELVASQRAGQATAWETFPLLPPVGFVPVDVGDLKSVITRLTDIRDAQDEDPGPKRRLRETAVRDLEMLTDAAAAASGPGFNPRTFFGSLARFGGVIDWEIAEFLLRESWYRPPVVVPEPQFIPNDQPGVEPFDFLDNPGGLGGLRRPRPRRPPRGPRRHHPARPRQPDHLLLRPAERDRPRQIGRQAPLPQTAARPDRIQPLQPLRRVRRQLPVARSVPAAVHFDRIVRRPPDAADPGRPAGWGRDPSMTDLAVRTVRIHGTVPGSAPRAAAEALLRAMAPTMDDHGVLIVRRLRLDGFRGDDARGRLAELRRRAARPALAASGTGWSAQGAEAVWFRDEVEALACLTADLIAGSAAIPLVLAIPAAHSLIWGKQPDAGVAAQHSLAAGGAPTARVGYSGRLRPSHFDADHAGGSAGARGTAAGPGRWHLSSKARRRGSTHRPGARSPRQSSNSSRRRQRRLAGPGRSHRAQARCRSYRASCSRWPWCLPSSLPRLSPSCAPGPEPSASRQPSR